MLAEIFTVADYADLPGWPHDDLSEAFDAFRLSAIYARDRPYRSGSLGITYEAFAPIFEAARASVRLAPGPARQFFERHFVACKINPGSGLRGFVTGYYEPEVHASRWRDDKFRFPLMKRPDDLIKVSDDIRPKSLETSFAYARMTHDGLTEYHDRQAIENGVLSGKGLEIAWLADPVDVFFIHVQGAARLVMEDGEVVRITYAAKSGHDFTGPGKVLAGLGEIPADAVTMQSIRNWFAEHPHRINEILWQNRSFIFFRVSGVDDPNAGPIAAAKVPLTAGRSLAVDRLLHTFGTPLYISAPELRNFCNQPFARLMIAQDTGSAIVGPARGDLFSGSGLFAGDIAGSVRHAADFFALVPASLI